MPIYVFHCESHGEWDDLLPVALSNSTQDCPRCGKRSKRFYTPAAPHRVSFRAGFVPGADRSFESKREFHTWLDKTGTGIKTNTGTISYG